jgi:uroporphyrinogen-III synthase
VPFEECVVYETLARDAIDVPDDGRPLWLAFFSPSGREAVAKSGIDPQAPHVRLAAIGPTTAGALEEAGWPVDAVADAPTPEALAEAIRAVEEKRSHDRIDGPRE